jgi:hypothetical protein
MASQFVEAIMAQTIARNDPETQTVRQHIDAQTQVLLEDLKDRKAQTIEHISQLLLKAKNDDMPQSVIGAYERLLGQVTAV